MRGTAEQAFANLSRKDAEEARIEAQKQEAEELEVQRLRTHTDQTVIFEGLEESEP